MNSILINLLLGSGLACCALAQPAGTSKFDPLGEHLDLQKLVRVQVEFIEMPHEQLTELLAPARRGANDQDLRKKAHDLVSQTKARVMETAIVTTRSGQRAKIESVVEFIYPTEFDPPETSGGARKKDEKDGNEGSPEAGAVAPPTPQAFETRNVGTTLEVDPVVGSDGISIDLNIAPELIYHVGESVMAEWNTADAKAVVSQPLFYTIKVSTAVTVISGQHHLAAVATPRSDEGRPDRVKKVLIFVKADTLLVGK